MNSLCVKAVGVLLLGCASLCPMLGAISDKPAKESIAFPKDDSVLDLRRDFAAKGDGVADDTEALQRALEASCRSKGKQSKVLFIPNGLYRVSRTLVVKPSVGPWVYGESRDDVVIRLTDGITDTNVTAVLRTHPLEKGKTSADWFMRNFRNLTIDVGNNPGVDGIRWYGNNTSILKNIRVIGRGKIGINSGFLDQSGPNLVQDAVIEGFETGILSQWIWGQTLSRITIRNCRSNGVVVCANAVGIEDLTVENTPVAIRNEVPNNWGHWGGMLRLCLQL
ncbi:MAG TPA: glycosyl hydrolase family 28-related protein [Verrucomicrobiae bacterium]